MIKATAYAAIGDNNPPGPLPIERATDVINTANLWMTNLSELADDEQAGKAQDFVTQITAVDSAVYAAMRAEKTPLEIQVKAIGEKYAPWTAKLEIAKKALVKLRTAYLQAKQARLDAQKEIERREVLELKRKADEAAAEAARALTMPGADAIGAQVAAEALAKTAAEAEKAAAKPAVARTTGAFSGRSSGLTTVWKARFKIIAGNDGVIDQAATKRSKIDTLRVLIKEPEIWNAMEVAALAYLNRKAREAKSAAAAPAGVEFYSEQSARG